MWKSISTMLAIFAVVIAVHSLVVVGLMKWLGTVHILLVWLIMTLPISRVAVDPYPAVNLILMLMRFGSGGPVYTLSSDTSA
jgi:hypothetical protein